MSRKLAKRYLLILLLSLGIFPSVKAQTEYRWLAVGDFHNFYSSIGSEIEVGFIGEQQAGWQWPGIYEDQDAQAAKAMWIGAKNFTDEGGTTYDYRVVHVGPRVTGIGEFYPLEMTTVSKFAPPGVVVDGIESFAKNPSNDEVDSDMKADREIKTRMNSLLGIEVERNILAFSQQYHDNYHIIEYTITNTGNTDADDEIELPNQTVEDVILYFQNRMAPVSATRYLIGNGTGWGMNTMNDRRGDGLRAGEPETFRASYAWHGYFSSFTEYNNIGGPIFHPDDNGWLAASDTTGRLGAYHFVGTVTLHADTSPTDETDDPNQPFTMDEVDSDHSLTTNNDAFNIGKMKDEYVEFMSAGRTPRHAYKIEPSGEPGFINPTGTPSDGSQGGFSYTWGYGPYTLAPGESVRIVVAEGASGLSREAADTIGRLYKESGADDEAELPYTVNGSEISMTKNEWVFTGKDSLFQTFERALANYEANYEIPSAPEPPSYFSVTSAGDGIEMEWEYTGSQSSLSGFEIYRASSQVDSTYRLLYEAGPADRYFKDGDAGRIEDPSAYYLDTPVRGRDYYYYIVAIGDQNTDPTGLTPTGTKLRSSRYYTQSFDPANLLRQAGEFMTEIRVVPNPYRANIDKSLLFVGRDDPDRLAFFEIPGICTIQIYTEIGELIRTLEHTNGSGDEYWDLRTDSRQKVVSGIYIARFINQDPNSEGYGQVAIRKIVIIL